MALALIAALYGIALSLGSLGARVYLGNGGTLAFQIVVGIGVLVLPLVVYSAIDLKLTKMALERVGKAWSAEHGVEFQRVEMHKNHLTLLFRRGGGKIERQKFRIAFVLTTWKIKRVEWL